MAPLRLLLLATTSFLIASQADAQSQPSVAAPASPASDDEDELSSPTPISGQVVGDEDRALGEIIVTAQKREQAVNTVGMSITALGSQALAERGVESVADLVKVVPGFVYTPSPYQTPVYTLRGVGVYESGFATSPAVTVYVDEVPLAYPVMQVGLGLDLDRLEVLKGPQGTLFGGNSTGGAINYIAAKPTDHFTAGASLTLARFGATVLEGFVSGPASDTLTLRLAALTEHGGAWQRSISRPGDRNGDREFYQARLLAEWRPTERLSMKLNINGFYDRSQIPAPQLKFISPSVLNPALPDANANYPGYLNVPTDIFTGPVTPATIPQVVKNATRASDWSPDWNGNRRFNHFVQLALRADYEVADALTLTALTSYAYTRQNNWNPLSGTALPLFDMRAYGSVKTLNQEFRLSGSSKRLNWVIGAAYAYTDAAENNFFRLPGALFTLFDFRPLAALGVPPSLAQLIKASTINDLTAQTVNEYAAFANGDLALTERLSVQAGLRYTRNERNARICDSDPSEANQFGKLVETLQFLFKGSFVPVPRNACVSLDANFNPGPTLSSLDEDNLSWRFGVNYKVPNGPLVYANASRGYKAGVVAVIGASSQSQLTPITQERLDAYEIGIKVPFERVAHLNAAAFYYDYRDKQLRGTVDDPFFGALERLINVPKSRIAGLEASIDARPLRGLTVSAAGTYLDSKVAGSFITVTQQKLTGDVGGSRLPLTPKWTFSGDAQYDWQASSSLRAFVGAGLVYHSATNVTFETDNLPAPDFVLPAYTTLDVRAGMSSGDERWRFTIFGRNVTNRYYIIGTFNSQATRFAYTGMPMTFGGTVSFRF